MSQSLSPRQMLLDIICRCEDLERFAIENYHYKEDIELASLYSQIINWSYGARLVLGYDKQKVLDRYRRVQRDLERSKTKKVI